MLTKLSRERWGKTICLGTRKDTGTVYLRTHNSMTLVEIADEDLEWAAAELLRRAAERRTSHVVPVRQRSRATLKAGH